MARRRWWLFMWFFRWWLATKALPQAGSEQANGRSLVCVRVCFFKSLFVVKRRGQPDSLQLNVFPGEENFAFQIFCWLLWRGWFAWTGVTVYSEEKSTRVCGHTFLEFEFDNLCGFSCVLSACRGWRRLRRSRRIPRTQKASPSCGSWPQNSNLVTSQHLRHGNLDI